MLTKIHTTENGSDMLTKVLTPDKLEADRIGATSHAGVKGEFVGKHVPPDGRYREPADLRTGSDRFRSIGKDTNVNMPKVIYV